jgi:DNA-directed RNA polymerase II subunit RPB3
MEKINPQIDNIFHDNNILQFTLQNVNVSVANTLRRTILSDIETFVFRTTPYEQNDANIEVNTTRLNNEILKQRLSCIPIHIKDEDFPHENFILIVDQENESNVIQYVTTEHFKLYDTVTKTYMPEKDLRIIFPKNPFTNYYIDFARLRPRISDEIPGETLKLTCKLRKCTAKDDYMYNAACNSSYGFTQDRVKVDDMWNKKEKEYKENKSLTQEDIEYMKNDWYNLDAKRIFIPNSFNFTVETVGVYTPYELVKKACKVIYEEFKNFHSQKYQINNSDVTMDNSFDIILFNKDHTFGKCLEYLLYTKYFEGDKILSYCGFQKIHPHDEYSIVRLAYHGNIEQDTIIKNIQSACDDGVQLFKDIEQLFID